MSQRKDVDGADLSCADLSGANLRSKETSLKKMQMNEMGLFRTPKSVDEIWTFIDSLPMSQQATAWTVYGLLNNLIVDRLRTGDLVLVGNDPTPRRSVQKRDEIGREFV